VSDLGALRARASRDSHRLSMLNKATLVVAVVVYATIVTFCILNSFIPPIIFSSCVMLAELLVFQFVRTMLAHFALWRSDTE
jgi:hypothetical protein